MTIIIKCDRCGCDKPKKSDENELHFTKARNTRFGYDKLIHLCDECLEDFDKWMLNRGSII